MMDQINKEELIDKLIYELPMLRARLNLTQDEIGEIAGLSRQTYSALETGKRKMTWSNFLVLMLIFHYNPGTREMVEKAGIFPDELKRVFLTNRRDRD